MDRRLLDILCCPSTRQPLALAGPRELEALNRAIAAGSVRDQSDTPVSASLAAALLTRDRRLLYPIEDDIPILLSERAIASQGIADFPQ
ncbi:MAG TPA: hypothetical protein DDZ76_06095 [Xanthomonadales bacterium]|nr:hypothetical protein [Xanthomonadales bacterium]